MRQDGIFHNEHGPNDYPELPGGQRQQRNPASEALKSMINETILPFQITTAARL